MSKLSQRSAGKEKESRLLIAAAISLFVVCNILLAYLASTFGWYFLATDRMFYTLSGVTDEYFDAVNPDGKRVEFYFCMSKTGLTENNTFERILNTVEQFDERYDFFSVKHLDTYYDYATLEKFSKDENGDPVAIDTQSVILHSPDTGKTEIRSLSTFYHFDAEDSTNDDMIFNGEEIVAALVGAVVSEDRPKVLFTMGHGEAPSESFTNAFYSAGFDITASDISTGDIPDDVTLVVIANPKYDFEEYADKSITCEISRLRDFVTAGGTVIYMRSTSAGTLPRIEAFYAEYGILAEGGMVTDGTHSVDPSGKSVLLHYGTQDAAASVRDYAVKYNGSRLVAAGVSPLTLTAVDGATPTALLQTFDTAVNEKGGETVSTAPLDGYTVAAYSVTEEYHGKRGYVAMVAADAFADVDTMETDGYANKEFLFSLLKETTGANTPIGCGVVLLNTYPLEDMTRGTANVYLAVLAGVLPLAVALTGIFVLRRRAHK